MQDPASFCLEQLLARGFEKAQVQYTVSERDELQAELGKPSLFRTVKNTSVELTGIVNGKKSNVTINSLEEGEITRAIDSLRLSAEAAMSDDANAIAERQPSQTFSDGVMMPDHDRMYDRLAEFLDYSATAYPSVTIGMAHVTHLRAHIEFANSNGVQFQSKNGCYQTNAHFSAKEGNEVSSLNGTYAVVDDLDTPMAESATFDRLLREATEQVHPKKVPEKFSGDLIMTPDSAGSFFGFLTNHISGGPMVAGTSAYLGRVDDIVASTLFSLRSQPCSRPGGYRITRDGYPAQDSTIVEKGVLKTYLLDLYASRKTGLPRAVNTGGFYSIDAGDTPLNDMLASVERGILIGRFSGGQPSIAGDFSGIAKNSYYIEDGKVLYPIAETMISGNMIRLLQEICAISKERADYGVGAFPWLQAKGITVS